MNQVTKRGLGHDKTELLVSKSSLWRLLYYAIPVLAVGLALFVQFKLTTLFGFTPNNSLFMLYFAAVIVAAWFGGLGAGLLATALAAVSSNYFLPAPQYTMHSAIAAQDVRLAAFVLGSILISAGGSPARR
jgi:K+-sensing histidine kinase KdpD